MVSVGGLVLSLLLCPEFTTDIPDISSHLQAPNPQFPIPEAKPRRTGALLDRPFLFEVASSDKMTGLERENRMKSRYEDIVSQIDSDNPPQVDVDTSLGVATVTVDGKAFATVLPQDCPEYYSRLTDDKKLLLEQEVAYGWARKIDLDLHIQAIKRHPKYLQFYNALSIFFFFVTCVCHLTLDWISRRFARTPLWSLKALLWLVYFTGMTVFHPSLDDLSNLLRRGALYPLSLLMLCALAVLLLHEFTSFGIRRYFRALASYEQDSGSLRSSLRRKTLEQACTFVSKVSWTFLGLCLYLYALGADLTSFFAGAGLVGVAIGVMARDIFLDFFNGINILAEDQFGVGDWIETDNDAGEVVAFSLRSTKIRRTDGSLATMPNSDMRRVKNHSNEYAMVDFRINVTYGVDIEYAMNLIMDEISLLDTEWQNRIDGPANPMGINELSLDGVVLRVMLRTAPLAQWETHRRLNVRVKKRFDQEGIEFARRQRIQLVEEERETPSTILKKARHAAAKSTR